MSTVPFRGASHTLTTSMSGEVMMRESVCRESSVTTPVLMSLRWNIGLGVSALLSVNDGTATPLAFSSTWLNHTLPSLTKSGRPSPLMSER